MHDCLITGKSTDVVRMFKKELLTRFIGTDEGEVTQYLGCELIRDREAKTAKLVQARYAERYARSVMYIVDIVVSLDVCHVW